MEDWLFDVATPLGFRTYPTDAVKEGEKIWPR